MSWRTPQAVLDQIDGLLARAALRPGDHPSYKYWEDQPEAQCMALAAAWAAAIERFTPRGSQYREMLRDTVSRYTPADSSNLATMVGILNAIRNDVEDGYMQSIEELVHADVFADFLEMAGELHAKGYEHPAAVLVGSVLEEHSLKTRVQERCGRRDNEW